MKFVPENAGQAFPWRTGQRFRLLVDGVNFFPAMLQAIDAAKSHVLIEMYIMESGLVATDCINGLLRAVTRGVRVSLLLDDYGSRGLSMLDRKRLRRGGAQLTFHNPLWNSLFSRKISDNLFRTHRKLMVVDGVVAFVGGTAVSDSFVGANFWHDCMLEISGTLALDWQALFSRDLARWSEHVDIPAARAVACKSGRASGRLVCSSGGVRLPLKKVLLNRIRHAQQRIWIASAYFIPSAKIRRALSKAARQGRDVRLLLPGPITDHPAVRHASRRYYARLLRHGVRIFEYQERFSHTKVCLVDDWCTIGSSNLDRWNFRWNLEANQEVEDTALAKLVREMLLHDLSQSEEIAYKIWMQRSWIQRLKEWLWGRIDRWVT